MPILAEQLGRPRGFTGRLVGRYLARRNAEFNRWVVGRLAQEAPGDVRAIVELGPGPGLALEGLLRAFPRARVWGIDHSSAMLAQAGRRNAAEVATGRLSLLEGDVPTLATLPPVDIILAVHVLYFWHEPVDRLTLVRRSLRPGGWLALGYSLRRDMPDVSQRQFPRAGHRLYESDADVARVLALSGFGTPQVLVKGSPAAPEGRLALVRA